MCMEPNKTSNRQSHFYFHFLSNRVCMYMYLGGSTNIFIHQKSARFETGLYYIYFVTFLRNLYRVNTANIHATKSISNVKHNFVGAKSALLRG